jgi:predicted ribosomally synthesized peptide with nif11-like leader
MSVESAKKFLEMVKGDEDFRKKLENASSDDARKRIVEDKGFDFTKVELKEAAGISGGPQKIGEEDLQAVAGGGASDWVSATGTAAGAAIGAAAAAI